MYIVTNREWLLVIYVADKREMMVLNFINAYLIERGENLSDMRNSCMLQDVIYVGKPFLKFFRTQFELWEQHQNMPIT